MNHSFNIELAKKYGIEEAILIENIAFWQKKNEVNEKNNFDGFYWVYNSTRAFNELFPYMSQSKIRRCLLILEEKEIIKSGCYNKHSYDRTKWYSLVDESICELYELHSSICKMEVDEPTNGCVQTGETIPVINPIINTYIVLLDYWNSKNIIKHRKDIFLANIKSTHKNAIKIYGIEEIKKAIDNYKSALDQKSWFKHKYDLFDFIYRSKSKPGILRFLDGTFDINEYPPEKKKEVEKDSTYDGMQEI